MELIFKLTQVDKNASRYGVVYDRIRQRNGPFSGVYDDITVRKITVFTRKDMSSITAVNDRTVYDSFMASYTDKYGTVNATFSSRKRPVFIRISHVYFSSCCSGILCQHTYPIAESPRYPYSLLPRLSLTLSYA